MTRAPPGSRENPLPVGATVVNDQWDIALGTPREAGNEVSAENQFNDLPKPGMEYWLVPVTATYTGDDTGTAWVDLTIKFVGSDNKAYSDRCGVIPNDLSDVDQVYPGGIAEGNSCIAVPAGADGLWSVSAGFTGKPSFRHQMTLLFRYPCVRPETMPGFRSNTRGITLRI